MPVGLVVRGGGGVAGGVYNNMVLTKHLVGKLHLMRFCEAKHKESQDQEHLRLRPWVWTRQHLRLRPWLWTRQHLRLRPWLWARQHLWLRPWLWARQHLRLRPWLWARQHLRLKRLWRLV